MPSCFKKLQSKNTKVSPPGVARGRFVGRQQSGLAGCKPPPLFKRGAPSCWSQRQRQREPWGAHPRPSAPSYLPTSFFCSFTFFLSSYSSLLFFFSFFFTCFLCRPAHTEQTEKFDH